MDQRRRIVTEIPGPASRALLDRRRAAVPRGVGSSTPIFARVASGAIIEDVDGNALIDLGAGLAVLNVGNASPPVVAAARAQLEASTHTCFQVVMNEPYVALAERLNALTPGAHEKKTLLLNSGAEAVENAVKIARYATGREAVAVFEHGFHGRTLLGMTLTAKQVYKQGFGPYAPEIHRLPFAYPYRCPAGAAPDACGPACADLAIEQLRALGAERFACVVIEPILGEGGFIVPADGFVRRVADFCADNGILLVADEVQTGFARTGTWFGIEHEDVTPDLVASAKALGGGLPIAAVTGRADVMEAVHVGGLGGTFAGNPVACAAALAVIEQIETEDLRARAVRIGDVMRARLMELQQRCPAVGDVRGRGAMWAIELVLDRATKEPAPAVAARAIEECYREGVVVLKAGTFDNVIRLLPPLTIAEDLLDEGLGVLEKAVETAWEGRNG